MVLPFPTKLKKIFFLNIYLFGCIGSYLRQAGSLLRRVGFSLVVECGLFLFSSRGARAPECMGSGVYGTWALSLRSTSSVVMARGLSYPAACGIPVPRPEIEPVSPALEGGFITTGPPGKSLNFKNVIQVFIILCGGAMVCTSSLILDTGGFYF